MLNRALKAGACPGPQASWFWTWTGTSEKTSTSTGLEAAAYAGVRPSNTCYYDVIRILHSFVSGGKAEIAPGLM